MVEFQRTVGNSQEPAARRSRMGCFWVVLVAVCLLLGASAVNFFRSKPLHLTEETTYITEPLTADGQRVDYFARMEQECYPANLATDENGFRLLLQRVIMPQHSEPWHFQSTCKKLGLDAETIHPDLPYQEPFEFLTALVKSDEFDRSAVESLLKEDDPQVDPNETDETIDASSEAGEAIDASVEGDMDGQQEPFDPQLLCERIIDRTEVPWTLDELPMMEAWLEKNNPALDLVSEAVQKPIFYIPLARQNENDQLVTLLLPNVQAARSFARGLKVRAYYRIGTGDIDGAIDDIVACKRFGRHIGHGVTLIHLLVGIAIEGIADSVGIAGSPHHLPTKEQLQRYIRELDGFPPAGNLDEKMRFERYMGLDIVQRMAHGDMSLDGMLGNSSEWMSYLAFLSFDWDVVATRLNNHYDLLMEDGTEPDFSSPAKLIFNSRSGRSKALGDLLAAELVPGLNAVQGAERRRQCVEQMKRIVLAMLLYERDHATLPPAYSVDAQGTPLHSWRVLLFPYLGQEELYAKIRLDESWDSEHNSQFHNEVVALYQCPSVSTAKPGQTTYSVVVGPEMPFEAGEGQAQAGKTLAGFGSDNGNLILLSERAVPVCWMEPTQEIPQGDADAGINFRGGSIDAAESVANGIASEHGYGANFGCRDGGVRFLTDTIDKLELQKLLRGKGSFAD